MDLYEKVRKIEALIERGASEGEKEAAQQAKQRLLGKIEERPLKYKISSHSLWEKRLFAAVCKKHGYQTFRYHRQKYTTSNVEITSSIMDNILWPEYEKFAALLREMVDDITTDLINKIYCSDEEEIVISGELTMTT